MITTTSKQVAQNPLVMRSHRLIDAFAKSDDERDFYLDRQEGFLIYVDLDKSEEEIDELLNELSINADRYCLIPKLTFFEVKKIMEGFVTEKIYDIDTKEKLLDIIQSKEARENFLEFVYDHHAEFEKWQQYYQEKFRVRIIEWLRNSNFDFCFEEDLEITKELVEKLKMNQFQVKVAKDIQMARKILVGKARTYYSSEALNPRPKRGRPPKQVAKVEAEPQFSHDIYLSVPKTLKPFLYVPDYHGTSSIFTFSGKFASEEDLLAHRKQQIKGESNFELQTVQKKLQALRTLSSGWVEKEEPKSPGSQMLKDVSSKEVDQIRLNERKLTSLEQKKGKSLKKGLVTPSSKKKVTKASKDKVVKASPKKAKESKKESKGKVSSSGKVHLRSLVKKKVAPVKPVKNKKETEKKKQTQLRTLRSYKKSK